MNTFLKTITIASSLTLATSAFASDQLHNTKWTTYKNGKPDAVLKFTERNGKLSAKIFKILDKRSQGKKVCDVCKGKFHNKPLTGATVIWNLKADPKNRNQYIGGKGIEPESGMTFQGKATLSGNTLKLRGYKGFSVFGKTRILKRRR
ncbi:MAG: DUF2147 domain-containing protein [Moraxellaceae bacterium]|nr:DUF2147 domain-containing protein [Moraxellaceae bacterium]